jgi:hypothetical protein
MKREKNKLDHIKKFWNLTNWSYCNKCRLEFVRESGWRLEAFMIGLPYALEVCRKCCPTLQDADAHFKTVEDAHRKIKWKNKKR